MQTILDTSEQLATRKTSSTELVTDALKRASDPNGEGERIFITLYSDQAVEAAAASDRMRAAGIVPSPLAGVPVSIKDLFNVRGEVTSAGSIVPVDTEPAKSDAIIIQRLRAAGAIIVGRTNMTEFACSGLGINPHFGTPANPHDRSLRRIPGGSSSGAAVSVTDGMAVGAIGTDTGGSTRIPAALCGVVGFKPTQARVPLEGTFPLSPSLDCIGPIAPSVSCCALLDAVLSGESKVALPKRRAPESLTLGIIETCLLEDVSDDVAEAFDRACELLEAAGSRLVRIPFHNLAQISRLGIIRSIAAAEAYFVHRANMSRAKSYDPLVLERILYGATITAHEYLECLRARRELMAEFDRISFGFDGFVSPTTPRTAQPISDFVNNGNAYGNMNRLLLRNTSIFNLLNACAISVPCHEPGKAPVGMMLAGPSGRDKSILSVARTIESIISQQK